MGGCQNYGPLLGPRSTILPYYVQDPKKNHNFENHPHIVVAFGVCFGFLVRISACLEPKEELHWKVQVWFGPQSHDTVRGLRPIAFKEEEYPEAPM